MLDMLKTDLLARWRGRPRASDPAEAVGPVEAPEPPAASTTAPESAEPADGAGSPEPVETAEAPGPAEAAEPPPPPPPPAAVVEGYECYSNRGVLLPVVPGVFSDPVAASVRSGRYEEYEAKELDGLIQPGEVILEIGAGCGFISTYCAKNQHTERVHCVEANPQLIEVIRLTHRINGVEVAVHHEILGREDGETDFYVHEDFWASGTHDFLGRPVRVPVTSFQKRLDEVRPTMLVVDIEGGEEVLFEDVDLTGVKKILLELHQPTIGRHGIKRVFDLLSARDFHYDAWHSTRSVVTFSHVERI